MLDRIYLGIAIAAVLFGLGSGFLAHQRGLGNAELSRTVQQQQTALRAATQAAEVSAKIEVRVPLLPPEELLQECPFPATGGLSTNEDIVPYVRALRGALRGCNADKEALREWAKEVSK